jgi:hypothetical protein
MRGRLVLAGVAVLVGCQQGQRGPQGPVGPMGSRRQQLLSLQWLSRRLLGVWFALALLDGCAPPSVGEVCDRIMRTTCNRAAVCLNLPFSEVGPCVSAGVAECCDGPRCQAPVKDPATVDKCASASERQDCSAWSAWANQGGNLPIPGVCVGVAQPR